MYGTKDLTWTRNELRHRSQLVATIEPDREWPGLWRVRLPSGHLSDMVNLTRAKDAAVCLVVADLNARQRRAEAPPMRLFPQPVSVREVGTGRPREWIR